MDEMPGQEKETSATIVKLKLGEKTEPIASCLDMRLVDLSPGYARVLMKLKPEYQNFNGMVFGGMIMAVADQAFAYGCNSSAYPSIATQFNIHFIAGAGVNDEITAECRVVRSGKRVGLSEITVTNQEGKLIAIATGTSIPKR